MINDWIYMCKNDSFEKIKELLQKDYDIEVWNELGVIEVNKEGSSIDFEIIPESRWDELCKMKLTETSCDCMYQVSLSKGSDNWAEKMMLRIVDCIGGGFYGDTEDLMPHI